MPAKDVLAAGVVVFRPGKRVLLVHRPRYDDWSFPKGKLDPGEHPAAAAVREVEEETGLHVEQLTYEHDRDTLREARPLRRKTHPIVVLRHGEARSRKAWRQDDRLRPLVQLGRHQAQRLVPVLAAYDVTRIVSSSSARCVETVGPYADTTGWKLELEDGLTEEDATASSVVAVVDGLVAAAVEGAVLCTHRPVLPSVFDALGLEDPALAPGAMLVAHLRQGAVVATEVHEIH